MLTEDQLKCNLYPIKSLPAYKEYFRVGPKEAELKNKIIIIDCEMVMSGNSF